MQIAESLKPNSLSTEAKSAFSKAREVVGLQSTGVLHCKVQLLDGTVVVGNLQFIDGGPYFFRSSNIAWKACADLSNIAKITARVSAFPAPGQEPEKSWHRPSNRTVDVTVYDARYDLEVVAINKNLTETAASYSGEIAAIHSFVKDDPSNATVTIGRVRNELSDNVIYLDHPFAIADQSRTAKIHTELRTITRIAPVQLKGAFWDASISANKFGGKRDVALIADLFTRGATLEVILADRQQTKKLLIFLGVGKDITTDQEVVIFKDQHFLHGFMAQDIASLSVAGSTRQTMESLLDRTQSDRPTYLSLPGLEETER